MTGRFPSLTSRLLRLRPFGDSDLMNVYRGLSDPEVIKYYGVSYDSPEATQVQMDFFRDLELNGSGVWWAVCSPDNTTFYGAAGLNDLSEIHRKAEIGYWLLPQYWGLGYLQEALALVCAYGFKDLRLHRITATVETKNSKSIRAIEKAGFALEGTLRDCEWKNGTFISLHLYALLNSSK